jgi:uncharacterized glyoxalase superfamily protein PhnB
MKSTPKGWPRLSAAVYYDDPRAAIDWLCKAFGFEIRIVVDGEAGRIEHSELTFGEALIMVSGPETRDQLPVRATPGMVGGKNTINLMLYVDDVDAHAAHARAAGAVVVSEPTTNDYGEDYWADRTYQCRDLGGHHWWFCQRMRTGRGD